MNLPPRTCRTTAALLGVILGPLVSLAGPGEKLLEAVPADALVYVAWEPALFEQQGANLAMLKGGLRLMAEEEGLGEDEFAEWWSAVERFTQEPGVLALFGVDASGDEEVRVDLALVLPAAARESLDEVVKLLTQQQEDDAATEELRGTPVAKFDLGGAVLVRATRGEVTVLAFSEAAAEAVLARVAGEGQAITESARWQATSKRMPKASGRELISVYADVPKVLAAIRDGLSAGQVVPAEVTGQWLAALGFDGVRGKMLRVAEHPHGLRTDIVALHEGELKGLLKLWQQKPLGEADLRQIPENAYWAMAWNLDLDKLWQNVLEVLDEIDPMLPGNVEAMVGMTRQVLGFSVTDDLLPALGDTWILYDAPSQGGVLLTGSVLLNDVRQPDAVDGMIDRSVQIANAMLLQNDAPATVKVQQTQAEGTTIRYLTMPGLPIPVMPAWAHVDGWTVFGLWPQMVAAALPRLTSEGKRSVLDRPDVQAARRDMPEKLLSFSYVDSRHFAYYGYAVQLAIDTAMLSAGAPEELSNALKLAPPFPAVLAEQHDLVGGSGVEDGVIRYTSLGSPAQSGPAMMFGATIGVLAGIMLPSLARARAVAKRTVAASNLRAIGMAIRMYVSEHDELPPDLETLVAGGLLVREQLTSPQLSDGSEVAFVYVRPESLDEWQRVVAYEKLSSDEGTNVLFADGHVEFVRPPRLQQLLPDVAWPESMQRAAENDAWDEISDPNDMK